MKPRKKSVGNSTHITISLPKDVSQVYERLAEALGVPMRTLLRITLCDMTFDAQEAQKGVYLTSGGVRLVIEKVE